VSKSLTHTIDDLRLMEERALSGVQKALEVLGSGTVEQPERVDSPN
jgi:hypothetical protein